MVDSFAVIAQPSSTSLVINFTQVVCSANRGRNILPLLDKFDLRIDYTYSPNRLVRGRQCLRFDGDQLDGDDSDGARELRGREQGCCPNGSTGYRNRRILALSGGDTEE